MVSKPTQEEIDAAKARWDSHVARSPGKSNRGGWGLTTLLILAVVIYGLFAPAEGFDYGRAVAKAQGWIRYVTYRVPCMAPESSVVGKWVNSQKVDCKAL